MDTRKNTKRLGEFLVERRFLTSTQLEEALRHQRATGEFLGALLVRLGTLQPEALVAVLSEQFGMPHEPLTPEGVDWAVVGQFPPSVISDGKCFPIRADAESVTVAIANPLDVWSLSKMEEAARFRRVKPVLVMERELQEIFSAYRQRMLKHIETRLDRHGPD